ncbi:hypothetical protein JCM8097_002768 [Rhodosporidiobolus ruineniae]
MDTSIDWAALRADAAALPPPAPLPLLDRDSVLASHVNLLEREHDLDAQGVRRTRKVLLGVPGAQPFSRILNERIAQLDKVDLGGEGWQLDQVAQGKVLVVRIFTLPVRTSSVQFVVEDQQGRVAPLQLFHVPTRLDDEGQLADWFPVGGVFAIKEPLARSTRSGSYTLRLSSPSDLVRLFPSHPLHPGLAAFPSTSPKHPLDHLANSAEGLKEKGNEAFKGGWMARAKEAYEWALAASGKGVSEGEIKLRATVLSNLAATNLRLALPRSARKDCEDGLALLARLSPLSPSSASSSSSLDPLRHKLLYRLSLAHYALQSFSATLSTLSSLPAPLAPDAASLLSRARLRLHEQTHGPSPSAIRAVLLAAQAAHHALSPPEPPDLADFLSPKLEVVDLPNKGRGVLARAPIRRGELLMLFRPLASAPPPPEGRKSFTAGLNAWTETLDPPAVVEVAAELAWTLACEADGAEEEEVGELRRGVEELWAGEELKRIERREGEEEGGGVETARIEGVVTFNGFVVEDLATAPEVGGGGGGPSPSPDDLELDDRSPSFPLPHTNARRADDDPSSAFLSPLALYPAHGPSALNHSCHPSGSYTFLVSAPHSLFLLRARRDLLPGEELTIEYTSPAFDGLEEREKKCAGHGFRCACGACEEERAAGSARRRRRKENEDEAWALAHSLPPADSGPPVPPHELDRLVRRAEELHSSIASTYSSASPPSTSPAEPPLPKPALYAPSRLLSLVLARQHRYLGAIDAEVRGLEALGAVFAFADGEEEEGEGEWRTPTGLVQPPMMRDTDATLSCLWCAWCAKEAGKLAVSRAYVSLARDVEKGQAGEELFDLRFGGWMGRKGLEPWIWREEEEVEE